MMNFEDLIWLFTSDEHSRGIVRMNIAEAALLFRTAKETQISTTDPPLNFVEIGRKFGGSTVLIASTMTQRCTLWSIDIKRQPQVEENLKRISYRGHINLIDEDSKKVAKKWNHGPVQFLLIDGDHSFKGVSTDIKYWTPHVAKGGFVMFHDVIGKKHELQPLIDNLLQNGWVEFDRADSALCLKNGNYNAKELIEEYGGL